MKIFIKHICVAFLILSVSIEASQAKIETARTEIDVHQNNKVDSLIQQSNDFLKNDLRKSLDFALNALEISLEENNQSDLLHTYNQLGKVYFYVGMFENCYTNWHNAHLLAMEISDKLEISNTSFNLAALFIVIEEYDKAQDYLSKVRPYYFSKDSPDFLLKQLNVINNQALIHHKKGEINQAQKVFEEGISITEKLENKSNGLSFLNAYVSFLIEQKKYPLAIEILSNINQINNESDNYNAQIDATIQFKYAKIYEELNSNEKAKQHLNNGFELAKSINSISLLKEFNFYFYKIHKAEKNTEKALVFKERYDSLFQLEQINESKLAIVRDEFKEELIKFQNQYDSKAFKLTKQKTIIYSLALFIILTLLYYLIHQSIKRKKEKSYSKSNINTLEKKVKIKEKEIITLELKQIQQRGIFEKIISQLQSNTSEKKSYAEDKSVINSLNKERKSLWEEFELRFNQTESDFYTQLEKQSQELTKNERRLCALIRLDFSSKEIAHINNQSLRSVEIARTRIRKKLNLTNTKIKLDLFLKQL